MEQKLTKKEQWFLDQLNPSDFISPGILGGRYYKEFGLGTGHSSSASPVLLKLVRLGLAERNKSGHYKLNCNQ